MPIQSKNFYKLFCLSIFCILGLTSCAEWQPFYEESFEEEPYSLEYKEVKTPTSNRIEWRFKYGDLPALPINATTTEWGPPYSDDIFGADAYQYLQGADLTYTSDAGSQPFDRSMLYISPNRINENDYEIYSRCILTEWAKINTKLEIENQQTIPVIIGIVYGNPEHYTKEFRGLHEGKPMLLRIENDGRVRLIADDKGRNENYSGLSKKVHMPGKIIYLNTKHSDGGLSMEEVKNFKTELGVDPTAFFQISDEH